MNNKIVWVVAGSAALIAGSAFIGVVILARGEVRQSTVFSREESRRVIVETEPLYLGTPLSDWERKLHDNDPETTRIAAEACSRLGRGGLVALHEALADWYDIRPLDQNYVPVLNESADAIHQRLVYLAGGYVEASIFDVGVPIDTMMNSPHPGFRFLSYTAAVSSTIKDDERMQFAEMFLRDREEKNRRVAAEALGLRHGWDEHQIDGAIRTRRLATPYPTPAPSPIPTPVPTPTPEPPKADVIEMVDGKRIVGKIVSRSGDGKIVIETSEYGTLTLDLSSIAGIGYGIYVSKAKSYYLARPTPLPRPTPGPTPIPSPSPVPSQTPKAQPSPHPYWMPTRTPEPSPTAVSRRQVSVYTKKGVSYVGTLLDERDEKIFLELSSGAIITIQASDVARMDDNP